MLVKKHQKRKAAAAAQAQEINNTQPDLFLSQVPSQQQCTEQPSEPDQQSQQSTNGWQAIQQYTYTGDLLAQSQPANERNMLPVGDVLLQQQQHQQQHAAITTQYAFQQNNQELAASLVFTNHEP
jgi:hypothetical protein